MSRVWYYVFVSCLDQVLPLFSWPHRGQLDRGFALLSQRVDLYPLFGRYMLSPPSPRG